MTNSEAISSTRRYLDMSPNEIQEYARRLLADQPNPWLHRFGDEDERIFAAECIRLRAELDALVTKYQERWSDDLLKSFAEYKAPPTDTEWFADPSIGSRLFGGLVHDEVLSNAPTPAYRCATNGCPEREPVKATEPPKCYTCDRRMTAVVASDKPLTLEDMNKAAEKLKAKLKSSKSI